MKSIGDEILIERYVRERSDEAFRELALRYADLVYSVCRRRLVQTDIAEDAAQAVFLTLARKADRLLGRASIADWLYVCSIKVAQSAARSEGIRRRYECVVFAETPNQTEIETLGWVLDDALSKLRPLEQRAILYRYLQGHSLKEVGEKLAMGEDAARMRVNRALESLRKELEKAGVTVSTAVLAIAIPQTVYIAPPDFRARVGELPTSGKPSPRILKFAKGNLKLMPVLPFSASIVVMSALAIGGAVKWSGPRPESLPPNLEPMAKAVAKQRPRSKNARAARTVTAKEGISQAISQFEGHWLWKTSVDQRGFNPMKTEATITLNKDSGMFEIRGDNGDTTDWKADPESGSWTLGSVDEGNPNAITFDSGTEMGGVYTLLYSKDTANSKEKVTLTFDHTAFQFVIQYLPKPGVKSAPGPVTVKMTFERLKPVAALTLRLPRPA